MALYRKRPIVVEAVQWYPGVHVEGVTEEVLDRGQGTDSAGKGWITTLEGPLQVSPGDWIITGIKGERYPCKPDIFERTYEPAPAPRDGSKTAAPAARGETVNTCDSVDWYEGDACVLDADHTDDHRDQWGATWTRGATERSVYRVHGPWWAERGHVLANYLPDASPKR